MSSFRSLFFSLLIIYSLPSSTFQSTMSSESGSSSLINLCNSDVKAKMEEHEIVPDVIDSAPPCKVQVKFDNLEVNLGEILTPTQVKDIPTHVVWPTEDDSLYTLVFTDPDAPTRDNPIFGEFLHWIVANIKDGEVEEGITGAEYIGSGPPKDTGLHRYVYLVYEQSGPLEFNFEYIPNTSAQNRTNFSVKEFAAENNLKLVAGNFYLAEYDEYSDVLLKQLGF